MKKLFSVLAVALFTLPIFAEDVVVVLDTLDFKDNTIVTKQGAASPGAEVEAVKSGVTINIDLGQNKGFCLTAFAQSTVTISATSNIKQINFEFGNVNGTPKDGGLDSQIAVGANSWSSGVLASQARFAKITVTLGEGSGEGAKMDTISATEAKTRAEALAENTQSDKLVVYCYVASIKDAYSSEHGNISVWLSDDPTSTFGDIQAYRAKCTAEVGNALKAHDRVYVTGRLSHSTYDSNGETKHSYQIAQGADLVIAEAAQGVENIQLTEKARKVMVDGVVYVIRDNKMFDLLGNQVR